MEIDLKTETGRNALPPRKAPYGEKIAKGVFLLLYAGKTGQSWGAKTKLGKRYVKRVLAPVTEMTYGTAVDAVQSIAATEAQMGTKVATTAQTPSAATYGDAWRAYIQHCKKSGKTDQAMRTIRGHGAGLAGLFDLKIATTPLAALNQWQTETIGTRGGSGKVRTANSVGKNVAAMKEALNRFGIDTPFDLRKWKTDVRTASRGEVFALMGDDLVRFTEACDDPDFAVFVKALAMTGARPGELRKATVSDLRPGGLLIRFGKTVAKTGYRTVPLSPAARRFFSALVAGRGPDEPLLGKWWGEYELKYP